MLPHIGRTAGGQRADTDDDLGSIVFVRRLRATGMSMARIHDYAGKVRAGEGTVAERRRMLEKHRVGVAAAIDELADALGPLDAEIAHYEAAERGVDLA